MNEQLQQLLNQQVDPKRFSAPFDALLGLRQREQEGAASLFKSIAASNPDLAQFLLGQPGVGAALTETPQPQFAPSSAGAVLGEAAGRAPTAPAGPKVDASFERLIAKDAQEILEAAGGPDVADFVPRYRAGVLAGGKFDSIVAGVLDAAASSTKLGRELDEIIALGLVPQTGDEAADRRAAFAVRSKIHRDPAMQQQLDQATLDLAGMRLEAAQREKAESGSLSAGTRLQALTALETYKARLVTVEETLADLRSAAKLNKKLEATGKKLSLPTPETADAISAAEAQKESLLRAMKETDAILALPMKPAQPPGAAAPAAAGAAGAEDEAISIVTEEVWDRLSPAQRTQVLKLIQDKKNAATPRGQ
jgi:hypothetical protein